MTTNFMKIKSMNVNEMARFFNNYSFCSSFDCKDCYVNKYGFKSICSLKESFKNFKQWLNQECEE